MRALVSLCVLCAYVSNSWAGACGPDDCACWLASTRASKAICDTDISQCAAACKAKWEAEIGACRATAAAAARSCNDKKKAACIDGCGDSASCQKSCPSAYDTCADFRRSMNIACIEEHGGSAPKMCEMEPDYCGIAQMTCKDARDIKDSYESCVSAAK